MKGHSDQRRRLPDVRPSITGKSAGCGHEYYVTVSFYPDEPTVPAEVFVRVAKQGTALQGWINAWATALSIALQYGVPWKVFHAKHLHHRFEDGGDETNPSLLHAISTTIQGLIDENKAAHEEPSGD